MWQAASQKSQSLAGCRDDDDDDEDRNPFGSAAEDDAERHDDDLALLSQLAELLDAEPADLPAAFGELRLLCPTAPLALVEAVLARRPELAKAKKGVLDACGAIQPPGGRAGSTLIAEAFPAGGGERQGVFKRMLGKK